MRKLTKTFVFILFLSALIGCSAPTTTSGNDDSGTTTVFTPFVPTGAVITPVSGNVFTITFASYDVSKHYVNLTSLTGGQAIISLTIDDDYSSAVLYLLESMNNTNGKTKQTVDMATHGGITSKSNIYTYPDGTICFQIVRAGGFAEAFTMTITINTYQK